ncbi:ferrochelatase [mine drainage metagenome]|uniref:Ferrochelatase n=1 Tax=mine drainage metagenome TaxID=410659 RepID=A0A1J5QT89_9ZZZZ
MTHFRAEPHYQHGTAARVGILLINLGTPDAPTPSAVRRYLKQFLSDRRVVEIPRAIWWLILNGIILNLRPRQSAKKYAQIWTADGSPLLLHTRHQAIMLKGFLGARGVKVEVEFGMRYGNPSVASAIEALKARNCDRILVVPMYPQYAASSSASALDAVWEVLQHSRNMPEIRTLRHYHDHPGYIAALAASVREHWTLQGGKPDKLLISFHGVPRYTLDKGDPYHCECHKTGRLLAEALGLSGEQYQVCFQSRFGRAEWLQPYFAPTLEALGRQKTGRVDVICPGFSSDCLETLEEIALEGKATFLNAGGGEFHYIPALNEREPWIHALCDIVTQHLQGWTTTPDAGELEQSRLRARDMGAKN